MDSYREALSHQFSSRYKLLSISVPKFKTSGDLRCFVSDFKDMMRLAALKPSHQLVQLKQAVPEEVKCLLYQQQVDTVKQALEVLRDLYEPSKDSSTIMQEILKITQQSGEQLRVLAG